MIALGVQRFAAGANVICLTYATDWWAVIGPSFDPQWVKISGHSEQLGPYGSTSHFVNNRHSRVKTQGASCNGGFGQTDGQRKFKLGIPKSRVAAYVRGASYIREKMVLRAAELSEVQQILVEHDIQKVYYLKLILVFLKKHLKSWCIK